MSTKTRNSSQDAQISSQNHVRKGSQKRADSLDVERLKINLGRFVGSLSAGGKVQAYEQIAGDLSRLAGLNGNAWSWRYVASVHSGTMEPGKKFVRALGLYLEQVNLHKKQWFYFARYNSVVAVYDKMARREIVADVMRGLGYKPVTYTCWMQRRRRK